MRDLEVNARLLTVEISKSLGQVGNAQEDMQCWISQDSESQNTTSVTLLKWLNCDLLLILSIDMSYY